MIIDSVMVFPIAISDTSVWKKCIIPVKLHFCQWNIIHGDFVILHILYFILLQMQVLYVMKPSTDYLLHWNANFVHTLSLELYVMKPFYKSILV